MAVRGDITVNFDASPRIVTVGAPSTEITIQDLVDTLRAIESEQVNLAYPTLIRAAGKDNLGSGYVGITATLQNALLEFQGRPGPSTVACSVSGGNLVAADAQGLSMHPLKPSEFVMGVVYQSTSPTLMYSSGSVAPITPAEMDIIAQKVWQQPLIAQQDPTTIGGFLLGKVLTVAKFLALKA